MGLSNEMAQMIQMGSIKYEKKITELTKPLADHLGVGSLAVHKIFTDGRFFQIANCPDIQAHMCEEPNFIRIPFYSHPDHHNPGVYYSKNVADNDWDNNIEGLQDKFEEQDDAFILINQKDADGSVTTFVCSLHRNNKCPEHTFLSKVSLLKRFFKTFLIELEPAITSLSGEKNTVNLIKILGEERFNTSLIGGSAKKDTEISSLEKTGILPSGAKLVSSLSKQELRCFSALIKNISNREIAESMDLSHRTIEHYFENIKNKLNISTRNELKDLADAIHDLDYL